MFGCFVGLLDLFADLFGVGNGFVALVTVVSRGYVRSCGVLGFF